MAELCDHYLQALVIGTGPKPGPQGILYIALLLPFGTLRSSGEELGATVLERP